QATVEGTARLYACLLLESAPPVHQLGPGEACRRKRAVVNQAVLVVLGHFDNVVNSVPEDNPRLRAGRGKDDVLEVAVYAAHGATRLLILKLFEPVEHGVK